MSDFAERLKAAQLKTEQVLNKLLPQASGHHGIIDEAMRYAALGGGKRLRPFLVAETAALFGRNDEAVWHVAAALECVHVYSLVHDDLPCMDDDDVRRGKLTVHKAYDEAIGVLAGDGLLTHAFEILSEAPIEAPIKVDLIAKLAKASGTHGMIGGQVIDIRVSETDRDEALITELQSMKTGALIDYAVYAGAKLGRADDKQLKALQSYARKLGLIFQITDDILDVEGDAQEMGKAARKDENLGKATFVSILGLDAAKEKARQLGTEAKGDLEMFGESAKILCETVDFVLLRRN